MEAVGSRSDHHVQMRRVRTHPDDASAGSSRADAGPSKRPPHTRDVRAKPLNPRGVGTVTTIASVVIAIGALLVAYHARRSLSIHRAEMLHRAYLSEMEARAALMPEMVSIIDRLTAERDAFAADNPPDDSGPREQRNQGFHPSSLLVQRIAALSEALGPYRTFNDRTGRLEGAQLSPERGQLLRLLVGAGAEPCTEFNFEFADLPRATLRRADLASVRLADATLTGADLGYANLSRAELPRADLREANVSHANLREANLQQADLSRANLLDVNASLADLQRANLTAARLEHASLRGADLRGATLRDAILTGANLVGTDLRDADLRGADIGNTDLRHANLAGVAVLPGDWSKWIEARSRWPEAKAWRLLESNGVHRLVLVDGWHYRAGRLEQDRSKVGSSESTD